MITYSNSFKTMLGALAADGCRISLLLKDFQTVLLSDEINYLTMRGKMISFLPAGKEHRVNDNGRWVREGRQEGKPGRVVRRLMSDAFINDFEIKDQDIEKFSNNVTAYVMCNGDGESDDSDKIEMFVCNGDFIKHYYDKDNYSPHAGGNLTNSCMANRPSSYFELYTHNHDVVNMVVALDSNRLVVGRALLWHTNDHGLCMDTIYAADSVQPMFINFAKANGIRYKSNQSCHHHQFDMLNGERNPIYTRYDVSIGCTHFCDYPYLDTLYYLDEAHHLLTNYEMDECIELRSTDGSYNEINNNQVEDMNGDMIDEDEAYYLDYRGPDGRVCGYAHSNDVVTDHNGRNVLIEDTEYLNDRYYLRNDEDIVYVDCENEYMHIDDVVFLECGDAVPCDMAIETRDGIWIHKDDARKTEDGDWIADEDAIQTYDDKFYHEDDCVRLSNGLWAHEDDDNVDYYEGQYFLKSEDVLINN